MTASPHLSQLPIARPPRKAGAPRPWGQNTAHSSILTLSLSKHETIDLSSDAFKENFPECTDRLTTRLRWACNECVGLFCAALSAAWEGPKAGPTGWGRGSRPWPTGSAPCQAALVNHEARGPFPMTQVTEKPVAAGRKWVRKLTTDKL